MRHIVHSVIKKSYLRFCRSISMFDLQIYEKLKKISRFLMGIAIFKNLKQFKFNSRKV